MCACREISWCKSAFYFTIYSLKVLHLNGMSLSHLVLTFILCQNKYLLEKHLSFNKLRSVEGCMCGVYTKIGCKRVGKRSAEFQLRGPLLKASKCAQYVKIYKNYRFKEQCQEKQNLTFHDHFVDSVRIEMTRLCDRNMNALLKNYIMWRWYKVYSLLNNSCDRY